ncbi:MAG TPA: hypothetical protein DCX07_12955, partial [Phycisphaerales bacterium]|nr:hypothetical protein [Phycisphaerales bacterium]
DALAKALSEVPVAARADGDAVVYETAVPWSRLAGIAPADKAFRFALVAVGPPREKGATPMALWGRGLYPGKEPRAFRLCTLEGAAGAAKPAGEFAATVEAQSQLPQTGQVARILADSQEDFTNVQGKGNWHYGYFPGTGDGAAEPYTAGDFREMKYVETMWGYEWAGPVQFLKLLRNGGHPQAVEGRQAWSVRRWKSDVDGTVRVSLSVAGGQKQSDGIGAKVLVDGVVVDSRLIGGPNRAKEANYDLAIPVRKGTVVDFAITCGPALNTNFDATKMTLRIALLAP